MRSLISRFIDYYLARHVWSFAVAMALLIPAVYLASRLHVNFNQLDMLPSQLPQVEAVRRIEKMTGGIGFLIVTIKHAKSSPADLMIEKARKLSLQGRDAEVKKLTQAANKLYAKNKARNIRAALKLKRASDDLSRVVRAMPDITYVRHKFKLDFVTRHVLYRIQTPDLTEAFRRIAIKRKEMIEKADPFYMELEKKRPYRLDLSDLYRKYSRIGKKEVIDDYYISPDRRMMVLLIKPSFDFGNIDKSRALTARVRAAAEKLKLEERGLRVDYTGSFAQYAYAYTSLERSLFVTGLLAVVLIALLLFFFVGKKRPISILLILLLLLSLMYALTLTFGIAYLLFGELNMVTSMMSGILAGLGIDFGIHFVSRLHEELQQGDLRVAMRESILSTGSSAVWSASTTAAAFVALVLSDFQGFSEFGILAGIGILLMALSMFFFTPLLILSALDFVPGLLDYLKEEPEEKSDAFLYRLAARDVRRTGRIVLAGSLLVTVVAIWFARGAGFDYDSRNMLESDAPPELLQEEMNLRFEIAGNPLAIAVGSLEEAQALWEHFEPLPKKYEKYVVNVVSLFSFVPPRDQQLRNYRHIQRFRRDSSVIKRGMIPAQYRSYWNKANHILSARPFTQAELPDYIRAQFRSIKSSKERGYLTFVYPDVTKLHLAQDIIALKNMMARLEFPMVGRQTLGLLAHAAPAWSRRHGVRLTGSTKKRSLAGMQLSDRDVRGILLMANRATERELAELRILPGIRKIILSGRPYTGLARLQAKKATAVTTGSTVLVALFAEIVLRESRQILFYTSILVLAILLLSFRRLDHSLLSLIPLLMGLALTFGAMAILDVKLNFFNTAVLPVLIGYGINNGIFIFRRFLETGSLSPAVFRTAKAVVGSSLTTLAGWGSLAAAQHPGLRSMGLLACIGLTAMMVTAVIVLPAVLALYGPAGGMQPESKMKSNTKTGEAEAANARA